MKLTNSFLPVAIAGAFALLAGSPARANNLILNGGFEDGTYTSTVGGYTNSGAPDDWVANYAFDAQTGFNQVTSFDPYAGDHDLQISNDDSEYPDLAQVSQSFSDVVGDSYTVTFYARYGAGYGADSNAFLELSAGSTSLTLTDTFANPATAWTEESFTFTGSGSDTLTIAAQTNPSEWYVDDVSVSGTPPAQSAPDQASSAILFGCGLAALGFSQIRSRRRIQA